MIWGSKKRKRKKGGEKKENPVPAPMLALATQQACPIEWIIRYLFVVFLSHDTWPSRQTSIVAPES